MITINPIPLIKPNTIFVVSGTISGYTTIPTLYYCENVGGGSKRISSASLTSFSFTHPGVSAGTYSLTISAASVNPFSSDFSSDFGASELATINYTVAELSISVRNIPVIPPNLPFNVTGSLVGYSVAPKLTYRDDTGNAKSIYGTYVTATSFAFTHPPLAVGNHTIAVSDGVVSGWVGVTVAQPISESAEGTTIRTATSSPLISADGAAWRLTFGGKVSVNNVIDPERHYAVLLTYHAHKVYKQLASGEWWCRAGLADAWHRTVSPLARVKRVDVLYKIAKVKGLVNNPKAQKLLSTIHSDVKTKQLNVLVAHARIKTLLNVIGQDETKALESVGEIQADLLNMDD